MKIPISIAMGSNPRTLADFFDGKIRADGVELIPSAVHPSELFLEAAALRRFRRLGDSFSSLLMAKAGGDDRLGSASPCSHRKFFHAEILVRRDAGIERPADLKGKRVGVPRYQQRAGAVDARVLEHRFEGRTPRHGVLMERTASHSHRAAIGSRRRRACTINRSRQEKSIGGMMPLRRAARGDPLIVNDQSRGRGALPTVAPPDIKPLFATRSRGRALLPQDRHLSDQPRHGDPPEDRREASWIVLNLLQGFRARETRPPTRERVEHAEYYRAAGLLAREASDALRAPLLRHGIAANRNVLETAARYSHEQGLTPARARLEEVFARARWST